MQSRSDEPDASGDDPDVEQLLGDLPYVVVERPSTADARPD
jgi:hypothetical protein